MILLFSMALRRLPSTSFSLLRTFQTFPLASLHPIAPTYNVHQFPQGITHLTPGFDFRSDTVTQPTKEMIQAMMQAKCGDDVYQEDPTVLELEHRIANLFGHPSALFVSSGTLSNQLAVRVHLTQPPYTVLCDERAHVFVAETGGLSFHSRAHVIPLKGGLTSMLKVVHDYVPPLSEESYSICEAPMKVVCLENTLCGSSLPLNELKEIYTVASERGLKVHLDGARIWNAAVASGMELKEYGQVCDSLSVCFSKGLGAPVGSCLIGSESFIRKARHFRKLFGGGMRQIGFLAAACLYALDHHYPSMIQRAHTHVQTLLPLLNSYGLLPKDSLSSSSLTSSTFTPSPSEVSTNMIFLNLNQFPGGLASIQQHCLHHGVRVDAYDSERLRIVTHGQLEEEAIEKLVLGLTKALHG